MSKKLFGQKLNYVYSCMLPRRRLKRTLNFVGRSVQLFKELLKTSHFLIFISSERLIFACLGFGSTALNPIPICILRSTALQSSVNYSINALNCVIIPGTTVFAQSIKHVRQNFVNCRKNISAHKSHRKL
jgi:hypothetical protein